MGWFFRPVRHLPKVVCNVRLSNMAMFKNAIILSLEMKKMLNAQIKTAISKPTLALTDYLQSYNVTYITSLATRVNLSFYMLFDTKTEATRVFFMTKPMPDSSDT